MNAIAKDNGVKSLLIMCDNEGNLGDPNNEKRNKAVENHFKWADAAKFLGCHSIRVNARSDNNLSSSEQLNLAADGLNKLVDYCSGIEINTIVENHGGFSSQPEKLMQVINALNMPNSGTLPDFGNWCIKWDKKSKTCKVKYDDYYKGIKLMMPAAKAVSAKSNDFDENGEETTLDYKRILEIVKGFGYNGFIGVEYEGLRLSEVEGIKATRDLLIKAGKSI